ncbi:HAD family hydrolase [Promicromonospora sp. Populi]|uniref:HAD family hydrolase n=1 Tax=Promicromonospora sp. Populi TaxID=3239420 RepID=UPI0034E2B5EA
MGTARGAGHRRAAGYGPYLVALDIDGTLLDTGMEVPLVTARAVAAARAAGHQVVLATGRSLIGALPVAKNLGLDGGWVVVSNGAVTARLVPEAPGGYVLHEQHTFDAGPMVRLARARIPDVQIGVEVVGWGYDVTHPFDPAQINGDQRVVGRVDMLWATPVTRAILAGPDVTSLVEPLRGLGVTATPNAQNWVDVTAPGLSKATALDTIRDLLRIDPVHTLAIGDGWNDREMLTWAEHGVAMGHAPEPIKALAKRVTGTIHEHGAATVLWDLVERTTALRQATPA